MASVEEQLAWAAGLFEGEGWFTRQTGSRSPVAAIRSTDRDVIERFAEIMGGGRVYPVNKGPGHKRQWHWGISGHDKVRRFGELIGPWLGERRRQQLERVLDAPSPRAIKVPESQLRLVQEG